MLLAVSFCLGNVALSAAAQGVPPATVAALVQAAAAPPMAAGPAPPVAAGFAPVSQQSQGSSTAEERIALREAKKAELHPPEKDSVEKGLAWLEEGHWIERVREGWHGFLPTLGGFPSGSGQAFGVVWQQMGIGTEYHTADTPNRIDVNAQAAASLRGYLVLATDMNWLNLWGSRFNLQLHGGYQRNSQEDFYGFGMDSSQDDRSNYLLEGAAFGTALWWRAPKYVILGGAVGLRDINVGPGTDERYPPTEEVYDPGEVPGLLAQPLFFRYDVFAQFDWRNEGNPYSGGLYMVSYTIWEDQDLDRFSFQQLQVDLQQYVPFLMGKRVIALRAKTVLSFEDEGDEVPFYFMPILGGHQELRGFDYARFTDLNSILLAAEYRAEVWMGMDLALFYDAGKVFAEHRDFNFKNMKSDYGFGIRMKTEQSTFLRFDVAFGGEGTHYYVVFDSSFDDLRVFRRVLKNIQ